MLDKGLRVAIAISFPLFNNKNKFAEGSPPRNWSSVFGRAALGKFDF